MTTIAFDGETLAADRQGDRGGLKCVFTKIWRLANGDVLAVSGMASHAQTLRRWYEAGAVPEHYPKFQENDEKNSTLVVMTVDGRAGAYTTEPYRVCEDGRRFTAWGSGRDYAIAAMACGKSAAEAVEIASRFDANTGMGVDFFGPDGTQWHSE